MTAGPVDALIAAQEALLCALEDSAPPESLERAFARCADAVATIPADAPRDALERARALCALLHARVAGERDALIDELGRVRRIDRWLASRRPAEGAGDTCDVRG